MGRVATEDPGADVVAIHVTAYNRDVIGQHDTAGNGSVR